MIDEDVNADDERQRGIPSEVGSGRAVTDEGVIIPTNGVTIPCEQELYL